MYDYLLSVFLGIVEGLTEFLPVSSTAHLRICEALLHIDLHEPFWKMYTIVIQLGAILAICDGLVWAELGAAMPGAGGSYVYLREIYGPQRLGKLVSFLFIWQLSFSAPLSIASGAIGFAKYTAYLWPGLETQYTAHQMIADIPVLGPLKLSWIVAGTTFLAVGIVLLANGYADAQC